MYKMIKCEKCECKQIKEEELYLLEKDGIHKKLFKVYCCCNCGYCEIVDFNCLNNKQTYTNVDKYEPEDKTEKIFFKSRTDKEINNTNNNNFQTTKNFKINNREKVEQKTYLSRSKVISMFYRKDYEKIQDYVKRLLTNLYNEKLLTEELIEQLQSLNYCKNVFELQLPLLELNYKNTIISGHSRYWKNFKVGQYYVCSQWWKEKEKTYDKKLKIWVEKILSKHGLM